MDACAADSTLRRKGNSQYLCVRGNAIASTDAQWSFSGLVFALTN